MTLNELKAAITVQGANVRVCTRSGKEYWVHQDTITICEGDDDLVYGHPVKPHLRDKQKTRWFKIKNLRLAPADAPLWGVSRT